jgi:serine/threonine-protein kinase
MSTPLPRSIEIDFDSDESSSALDLDQMSTVCEDPSDSLIAPAIAAFLKQGAGVDRARPTANGKGPREALLPTTVVPEAGCVMGGRYRLEAPLASGGMGSVWTARHIDLDVPVAIKLMSTTYAESARERARFVREAKAAARLRSRNVVAVLDYGVEQNTPYIVMERLDGEDLWTMLRRQRTLSFFEAAKLLGSIGNALELAHAAGIIHRDLKPENIFIARIPGEPDEVVKVLDFGVAKEIDRSAGDEATTTGVVVGTPHYMSPEQASGARSIDHRSDLWSVGVILYVALTARFPFEGTAPIAILNSIVSAPIRPPSSVAPHLSADVDCFFDRALARDPDARFQTIREMFNAFQRFNQVPSKTKRNAPPQGDMLDIASGAFVAIATPQIEAWAHGIPAPTRTSAPAAIDDAPTIVMSDPRVGATTEPRGWLSKMWSRLRA